MLWLRLTFSTLVRIICPFTERKSYLDTISTEDAKKYIADDQFAAGSMLPKIEAGVSFVEKGTGRRTIITDMAHAKDGYCEKTGTIIK